MSAAVNKKVSAEGNINGILMVISRAKGKLTAEGIQRIREMALDALEMIKRPNDEVKRIGFIILALQQSTTIKLITIDGKKIKRATVIDHEIYSWAIEQVHALAQGAL